MSLFKTFKTDNRKETSGIPITYAPNPDGTIPTFYVARQSKSNKEFQKVTRKAFKPYKHELQANNIKDEDAERLLKETFIKGCLRKWENVRDENDNEIPFNYDNADKLFTALPELLENLMEESTKLTNYQTFELEEDAKN